MATRKDLVCRGNILAIVAAMDLRQGRLMIATTAVVGSLQHKLYCISKTDYYYKMYSVYICI